MTSKKTDTDPKLASVGIEIGKDAFHVVAFDLGGTLVLRRKNKAIASGDW